MNSVWRIVDANLNRVREGLRVLEDVARFVLNDRGLSGALKRSRHELNQILLQANVRNENLLTCRESRRDVGRKMSIRDQKKVTVRALVHSNFKRTEEGLRALEECAKIVVPKAEPRFQALRFRIYELEKRTVTKF